MRAGTSLYFMVVSAGSCLSRINRLSSFLVADMLARTMKIIDAVESGNFEILIETPALPPDVCQGLLIFLEVGREQYNEGNNLCTTWLAKVMASFLKISQHINREASCQHEWKGMVTFAQIICIWARGILSMAFSPFSTLNIAQHSKMVEGLLAAKFPEVGRGAC